MSTTTLSPNHKRSQTITSSSDESPNTSETMYREVRFRSCPDRQCLLAEFFELHRDRLIRLVDLRMNGRLHNRFDAEDVIQEALSRLAQAAAADALARDPGLWPPYLWLRKIVLWTLAELQSKHLGVAARDVRREQPHDVALGSSASNWILAERLLGSITTPSDAAQRAERISQVRAALEQLEPLDREILVLRHVEQLTRAETAALLNISTGTAAKRYFRALARCRRLLSQKDTDNV